MASELTTVTRDVVSDDGPDYRSDRRMTRVAMADFVAHHSANHTAENDGGGG
jgi:hypothetical protein